MMTTFKLLRVSSQQSQNGHGEWQLWPKTPSAYYFANQKLGETWVDDLQVSGSKRQLFNFRDSQADLATVLRSLNEAGISQEEIDVDSN